MTWIKAWYDGARHYRWENADAELNTETKFQLKSGHFLWAWKERNVGWKYSWKERIPDSHARDDWHWSESIWHWCEGGYAEYKRRAEEDATLKGRFVEIPSEAELEEKIQDLK